VVVTGVRRGEPCDLQIRNGDLDRGLVHVAFNYVVRGGQRVRKDTKTHQDRWLAITPDTFALIASYETVPGRPGRPRYSDGQQIQDQRS
jgi:integrase